jgi:hypothetical protein
MQIFVKPFTGPYITLDVGFKDTIFTVKQFVWERSNKGIELDQCRLVNGGIQLDDGRTINDHNIREGATLGVTKIIGGFQILAQASTAGGRFEVGMAVDAMLGGKDKWYSGKINEVNGDGTYYIEYADGDKEENVAEKLIRTPLGKIITLNVHPSDTIFNIKQQLWFKEGIPTDHQHLVFCGKQLWNGRMVFEYNIQKAMRLILEVDPEPQSTGSREEHDGPLSPVLQLFAKNLTGTTIALDIYDLKDTILNIKQKIWHKEGILTDRQHLICADKRLENGSPLSEHSFQNGSTLVLAQLYDSTSEVYCNRQELLQSASSLTVSPDIYKTRPFFLALGLNTNDNFLATQKSLSAIQEALKLLNQQCAVIRQRDLKDDIIKILSQVTEDEKSKTRMQNMRSNQLLQNKHLSSKEKALKQSKRVTTMNLKLMEAKGPDGDEYRHHLMILHSKSGRLTGRPDVGLPNLLQSLIVDFFEPVFDFFLDELEAKKVIAKQLLDLATFSLSDLASSEHLSQSSNLTFAEKLQLTKVDIQDRAVIMKDYLWQSNDEFKQLVVTAGENYDQSEDETGFYNEEIREKLMSELGEAFLDRLESRLMEKLSEGPDKDELLHFFYLRKSDIYDGQLRKSTADKEYTASRKMIAAFHVLISRSLTTVETGSIDHDPFLLEYLYNLNSVSKRKFRQKLVSRQI